MRSSGRPTRSRLRRYVSALAVGVLAAGGVAACSSGGSGTTSCTLAGKTYAQNTCTETLQCSSAAWVLRAGDPLVFGFDEGVPRSAAASAAVFGPTLRRNARSLKRCISAPSCFSRSSPSARRASIYRCCALNRSQ